MMYKAHEFDANYSFDIKGVSYAGSPKNNTALFITKKVETLVENLYKAQNCLVFIENNINIPDKLIQKHCFVRTMFPQREYTFFVRKFSSQQEEENEKRKIKLCPAGYYVGENVVIGTHAKIEPLCMIGHDVVIGENACLASGTVIQNAVIGKDFISGANCVIGSSGFTMVKDENGNQMRIPTLGKVIIGNEVEIGALTNISRGSAGDTILDDNVKLDSLIHVGHDSHLHKNVEIAAGSVLGGFAEIKESTFVGVNVTIRNRIMIGKNAFIGMGAVVTKEVLTGETVIGNPARKYEKIIKGDAT